MRPWPDLEISNVQSRNACSPKQTWTSNDRIYHGRRVSQEHVWQPAANHPRTYYALMRQETKHVKERSMRSVSRAVDSDLPKHVSEGRHHQQRVPHEPPRASRPSLSVIRRTQHNPTVAAVAFAGLSGGTAGSITTPPSGSPKRAKHNRSIIPKKKKLQRTALPGRDPPFDVLQPASQP